MKKILKRQDGGISVMSFPAGLSEEKKAEAVAKWERQWGNATGSIDVADNEVPSDRYFRDAWDIQGQAIGVNMGKARQVHMAKIRKARDARLTELDKRMYGPELDAERQTLRDLPDNFKLDRAKTPEELKALWPEELE